MIGQPGKSPSLPRPAASRTTSESRARRKPRASPGYALPSPKSEMSSGGPRTSRGRSCARSPCTVLTRVQSRAPTLGLEGPGSKPAQSTRRGWLKALHPPKWQRSACGARPDRSGAGTHAHRSALLSRSPAARECGPRGRGLCLLEHPAGGPRGRGLSLRPCRPPPAVERRAERGRRRLSNSLCVSARAFSRHVGLITAPPGSGHAGPKASRRGTEGGREARPGPVPRDADRIMSGNCGVVAICVTQPLWPLRVPRRVICSVMVAGSAGVAAATRMAADASRATRPAALPPRLRQGKGRRARAGSGNSLARARGRRPGRTSAPRWRRPGRPLAADLGRRSTRTEVRKQGHDRGGFFVFF